ncbi:MAG: AI-2E family transporter, partial [Pseudomonadota bacterium]
MALPVQAQVRYWSVAAAVFFLILWFLGNVILPFVLGMAIAYCLDPLADWLESHGFGRVGAVVIVSLLVLVVVIAAAIVLLPMLIRQ